MKHPQRCLWIVIAMVLGTAACATAGEPGDGLSFQTPIERAVFTSDANSFISQQGGVPPAPAASDESGQSATGESEQSATEAESGSTKSRFDAQLVAAGQTAFQTSCSECHPLSLALDEKKSFASWKSTVWRMASRPGADVAHGDRLAIATYLASLSAPAPKKESSTAETPSTAPTAVATATEGEQHSQAFSLFGTVSPLWRGGGKNLQHPGFFPQTWVGVDWQSDSPLSARVTACIACHDPGSGDHFALVQASLRLDLTQLAAIHRRGHGHLSSSEPSPVRAAVEVGRFIVPFGAFASQSNPGVYRTVSRPLIYNMGQRIYDPSIGDPVLPMPYSDEGAQLNLGIPVFNSAATLTLDGYLVNGLQGGNSGVDFDASRDYVDNNSSPSVGGRVTLGNQFLRVGSSIINGRFNQNGGSPLFRGALNYTIFGADISMHYEDIFRFQAEYAHRGSDRVIPGPSASLIRESVEGLYVEGELKLYDKPRISVLARYDIQDRGSSARVPESSLSSGTFRVSRFTWGVNTTLPGGSLLMLNHEHWFVPNGLAAVDVVGVRWSAMF